MKPKGKSLGVYIHVPFCSGKCYYCGFVSGSHDQAIHRAYFERLKAEINSFDFSPYYISSVYFGGGTPSSVNTEYIGAIMSTLRENAVITHDAEITIECNPESLNSQNAAYFAEQGISRLSIGLQTADDNILKEIGRRHTVADFRFALSAASEFFKNISCDVMLGLPKQTTNSVIQTLSLLTSLKLSHISVYSLKIEAGTVFEESAFQVDDDLAAEMYEKAAGFLISKGYERYEVSNFSLKGFECRHNIRYWSRGDYVGFGVAAHSLLNNVRKENTPELSAYLSGTTVINQTPLLPADALTEAIMLGLRTSEGISLSRLLDDFGYDLIKERRAELECLAEFLAVSDSRVALSDKGFYVMNEIILRLLPR